MRVIKINALSLIYPHPNPLPHEGEGDLTTPALGERGFSFSTGVNLNCRRLLIKCRLGFSVPGRVQLKFFSCRSVMNIRVCLLLLGCCLLSGCDGRERIAIEVGQVQAMVELASTPEARRQGLMRRSELGEDQGMLMVYPSPEMLDIWMLNTLIPLDVGFFDAQGILINTVSMWPDGGRQIHTSLRPAIYALEMNMGWFERNGLKPGAELKLPYPIQGR